MFLCGMEVRVTADETEGDATFHNKVQMKNGGKGTDFTIFYP